FFYVCIIGAALSVVVQQIYETFFTKHFKRVLLMGAAALVTIGYYFVIHQPDYFNIEMSTKSAVFLFALLIVFIWIPSVKQDIAFHESFMSAFNACFTALLFSMVIILCIEAIIFAIDQLIVTINNKLCAHVLISVLTLLAPSFFLSLIPLYPNK